MKYKFKAQIVNRILRVDGNRQWSLGDKGQTRHVVCVCACACVLDPFATWEVHKKELLSSYRFAKDTGAGRQGRQGTRGNVVEGNLS